MAHNEEKLIEKCIESLQSQSLGGDYELQIVVVANACTDNTGEIVRRISQNANNLHLIEIQEKGKSHAIRIFKSYAKGLYENQLDGNKRTDTLLFLDADIRLDTKNAVYAMAKSLEHRPDLHAILPAGIPDLTDNPSPFLACLYKAKTDLAFAVKGTAFSGQCYMIRYEAAQQIEIPDYIMLDDFYISQKLGGGYIRDYDIRYLYSIPPSIRAEINKIFRHALGNAQMRSFFGRGLFAQPLIKQSAPMAKSLYDRRTLLSKWLRLRWEQQGTLVLFYLISEIGDLRGKWLVKVHGPENIKFYLKQWETLR